MPLFFAKKEVFAWIKEGKKTIDVRKGKPELGEVAVIQCGKNHLRLSIIKKESGKLIDVIRTDNFRLIIPSATTVEDALDYLRSLYGTADGVFTAYYLANKQT
jgi:ASC-1-like (ASCH) protein